MRKNLRPKTLSYFDQIFNVDRFISKMWIFLHIAYNRQLKYADNKFLPIVKIVMDRKYRMIVKIVEEAWKVIF